MSTGSTPKVSVIIATYHNPPRYSDREFVGEAVASVRAQTYQPVESFVVDGGSPDQLTERGFIHFAPGSFFMQLLHDANVCETFANGVGEAKGEWIIPMNADDQLAPHFVESALAAKTARNKFYHRTGVVVVSAARLTAAIERDNYIPYLAMFARWFWDDMGGFQDVLGLGGPCLLADWDMWIRIWQRYGEAAPIAYVTDPTVIELRQRADSASKWTSDEFERLRGELWKRRGIAPCE